MDWPWATQPRREKDLEVQRWGRYHWRYGVPSVKAAKSSARAAGVRPEVVGKPMPHIFRAALARLAVRAEDAVMIGDSPVSDVQGAQGVGLRTIWLAPERAAPGPVRPDLTIHHFAELTALL